jgi:hypothetical protein
MSSAESLSPPPSSPSADEVALVREAALAELRKADEQIQEWMRDQALMQMREQDIPVDVYAYDWAEDPIGRHMLEHREELERGVPYRLRMYRAVALKRMEMAGGPQEPKSLMSLCRVGQVWHLRYHNEKADFPVDGNKFLGWLAKLLAKRAYAWTVAELLGDPEGKLKADASLRGERVTDADGLRKIRNRLEDIDAMIATTGGSEAPEAEKAQLLKQVEHWSKQRRINSPVARAYNNIGTQKRQFILKLKDNMPQLAAHLKAAIVLSGEDFTVAYRPLAGSPAWHIENPTA